MEEAKAIQKRLKDALDLQKKAAQRYEQAAQRYEQAATNVKEDLIAWVHEESEVLQSTVDVEYMLEKLKEDRTVIANRLEELQLQNESDNSLSNQAQISDLMECVDTKNTQIEDLEKHIAESNQDNRTKNRRHDILTLVDSNNKIVVKTLFKIVATKRREQISLQSKFEDLTKKYEKLENEKQEMEKSRESNLKLRKEDFGMSRNNESFSDNEKDKKIEELQKQIEELQNKALTEKDCNVVEKKPKPRKTKSACNESEELDSFSLTDDSKTEDDVENYPDWRETPPCSRKKNLSQRE